jgi:hypothetical protein
MKATKAPDAPTTSSKHTARPQPFFGARRPPFFDLPPGIQPKLKIGAPGDRYEQEADAMAEQVVRSEQSPKPPIQAGPPPLQRQTGEEEGAQLQRQPLEEEEELVQPQLEEEEEEELLQPQLEEEEELLQPQLEEEDEEVLQAQPLEEEEEMLQPQAHEPPSAGPRTASAGLAHQVRSAGGAGQSLPAGIRRQMEHAFGQDFSRVSIHTDERSAQLNRSLGARAFTHGRDIFFNRSEYQPERSSGRRLLAHELTHVVQQRASRRIQREVSPAPTPAAGSAPGLARLPASERQEIRSFMTLENVRLTAGQVHSMFSTEGATMTVPVPSSVQVRFGSGVAQELQRGLRNVAATLLRDPYRMPVERTVILPLDLTDFGSDHAAYRFTHVRHTPPATAEGSATAVTEVLVERVGPVGSMALDESQQAAAQQRFQQLGFTRGSGWRQAERQLLLQAIMEVPESHLQPLNGLRFNRDRVHPTEPHAGGAYNPTLHQITMYDRAFQESSIIHGGGGQPMVPQAVRAIIHEIGHAVDLQLLRQRMQAFEAAQEAFRLAFQQYEDPNNPGSYNFPHSEQTRFDNLLQTIQDAETAALEARAASGQRWVLSGGNFSSEEGGTAVGGNDFRTAALADGPVRLSTYADQEWQEYFAEAYSLYITDPDTLEQLRPEVSRYFRTHHPR